MISVEAALAQVLALAAPLPAEPVPLARAAGRVMAAPAVARRDQPPFDASAMDGYALADPARPGDVFHVIGMAAAGHAFEGRIGPGEAVRIFTGGFVPAGADAILLQEDAEAGDGTVAVREMGANDPDLAAYRRGVAAMKALPASDPRGRGQSRVIR